MGEKQRAWAWGRLALIVIGAVVGLAGGWFAISNDAPRWVTAWAAALLIVGIVCTGMLGLLLWLVITESVRPRLLARRPYYPLSLATEQPALFGRRRFSMHPVRFWAGLSLNHSVFIGVLLFREPDQLEFATPTDTKPARERGKAHER